MSNLQQQDILKMIGREAPIFDSDLDQREEALSRLISESTFLVIGAAGSIGSAVVRELFKRQPKRLLAVDISENNLAELVRHLRSSDGYISGDFRTFCLDALGPEFDAFCGQWPEHDYVLNFSALKHVRSEKDPFTLMRLIRTNIFLTQRTLKFANQCGAQKYFCVSTDKATNPVNMMGASKRIMEMFLNRDAKIPVSSARFANVAFSDGSLLHSFRNRIAKRQPIAAPNDVKRYFVTDTEGATLCLFSTLFGQDRDIFFPRLTANLHLETFDQIAKRFLKSQGLTAHPCQSEDEARTSVESLAAEKKWPCFFFTSDTTGEKPFEEFFTDTETVDWDSFNEVGIVKNESTASDSDLDQFVDSIDGFLRQGNWSKEDLVRQFTALLPNFNHEEMGRNLDGKM